MINEVYDYLCAFGMGVFECQIDKKPIVKTEETLQNRYEEMVARLQKIENAVYNVISL